MTAALDVLQRVPLFAELDPVEVQQIAGSFKRRVFKPGERVTVEGEDATGFFVIESGTAKVTVRGEERTTLGPGDYLGEIALIDIGARTATVTAESELACYGLTFWEFRPLVEENAQIAWKLLQSLAKKLRAAEQR